MKTILALFALLSLSLVSHADVVIYGQTVKQTVSGKYATFTTNLTGYVVLSTDKGVVEINAIAHDKTFFVVTNGDYKIRYVHTSGTKQKVVIAVQLAEDIGSAILKGNVASLNVGTSNRFDAPQTMAVAGAGLSGDAPLAVLTEYTGVLAFDSKKTVANNKAGNGTSATVDYLKTILTGKGYTEIP